MGFLNWKRGEVIFSSLFFCVIYRESGRVKIIAGMKFDKNMYYFYLFVTFFNYTGLICEGR